MLHIFIIHKEVFGYRISYVHNKEVTSLNTALLINYQFVIIKTFA